MRIFLLMLSVVSLMAFAEVDLLWALKKGQPKEVAKLLDRLVGCDHWGGEEPYDADRRNDINAAMKKLRCEKLDVDEKKLQKRYANNPAVLNAIKSAQDADY